MNDLAQFAKRFPTEDACRAYIVELRWPQEVLCPRCGTDKVHKLERPWTWQCKQCSKHGYRFSPLVGTLFKNTNYPLRFWFQVIFLMCQSKRGISAMKIHRTLGTGSYRTAWNMCRRIRSAAAADAFGRAGGSFTVNTAPNASASSTPKTLARSGRSQERSTPARPHRALEIELRKARVGGSFSVGREPGAREEEQRQ